MDSLQLREATKKDAPAIVAVIQEAFEEYRGRLDPPSGAHAETVDKLAEKMETAHVVLAEVDTAIVGCVFYEPEGDCMHLSRLAVLPSYRRRGIGHALVNYVEERAVALGLRHVELGVRLALPENHAYYEQMGYRDLKYGAHAGFSEPTYAVMAKTL